MVSLASVKYWFYASSQPNVFLWIKVGERLADLQGIRWQGNGSRPKSGGELVNEN